MIAQKNKIDIYIFYVLILIKSNIVKNKITTTFLFY